MEPDKVIAEARARIIWGEEPASVRDFLISSGKPEAEAASAVKELWAERNREIRRIGKRDVVIGVVLMAGVFPASWYVVKYPLTLVSSIVGRVLGVALILAVIGLWKLVRGIVYLVRPQLEEASIPDLLDG